MANTFKVFTIADVAVDSGTFSTLYTCAGSTTTVVLGMNICNKIAAERDVTVSLLNETTVPADSTLEVFAGQKIVLEATDVITIGASVASSLDVTMSVMEIT